MLTPIKSIRKKCLDCCCGSAKEVRLCTVTKCALYPYRMGKRPPKEESSDKSTTDKKERDSLLISDK